MTDHSATQARPASATPAKSDVASSPSRVPAVFAALSGVIAAGAALATGELAAGVFYGIPSPLAAVGSAAIDFAPPGSKDLVVSLFGTNDKTALLALVMLVVLAVGAGIGLLARRRFLFAAWAIVALVGIGALASLRDLNATGPFVVVSAAVQAGVGLQALTMLLTASKPRTELPTDTVGLRARRGFLLQAGALGILAVAGGAIGRSMLSGRADATAGNAFGGSGASGSGASAPRLTIPQAVDPAASPGADASLNVPGLTPVVVPNDEFYRIDTALITPSVDVNGWSLRVFGMVNKEVNLTFAELVQLPLIERYVTIACVSNEVGGNLVGNAKWTGPRLADVLEMAGVQPGATQIVPRSVDGWTAGFPTAWLHDPAHPRDAIIAVKMNDAPLPAEHGFPARLIVPGLYGYVSATKWLKEIELTTLEAIDAYWVPRGWAKEAPILTQSRIDVPNTQSVRSGPVAVAGVAWAPDRGISKVEVRVDGGPWQAATLATELSAATWVQWKWVWQATGGQHILEVRATDGRGEVQTDKVSAPNPDGARGHHQIAVQVV